MTTVEEAKMNKEIQNRYGHLLNKYINAGHYPDLKFHMDSEKNPGHERYGNLLDNVSNPLQKMYDSMIRIQDMASDEAKRKAEQEEYSKLVTKGRALVARDKEKRYRAEIDGIVEGIMERKNARIEAEVAKEAAVRKEEQRKQNELDRMQQMIDRRDELAGIKAQTKAILEHDRKREEEHNRQMEWFKNQKRG